MTGHIITAYLITGFLIVILATFRSDVQQTLRKAGTTAAVLAVLVIILFWAVVLPLWRTRPDEAGRKP